MSTAVSASMSVPLLASSSKITMAVGGLPGATLGSLGEPRVRRAPAAPVVAAEGGPAPSKALQDAGAGSLRKAFWIGALDPASLGLFRITFGVAVLVSLLYR